MRIYRLAAVSLITIFLVALYIVNLSPRAKKSQLNVANSKELIVGMEHWLKTGFPSNGQTFTGVQDK